MTIEELKDLVSRLAHRLLDAEALADTNATIANANRTIIQDLAQKLDALAEEKESLIDRLDSMNLKADDALMDRQELQKISRLMMPDAGSEEFVFSEDDTYLVKKVKRVLGVSHRLSHPADQHPVISAEGI